LTSLFGKRGDYLGYHDRVRQGDAEKPADFEPKQLWAPATTGVVAVPNARDPLWSIALVPAPGANLVRFHGQFAPNARWRAFITSFAPAKRKRPRLTPLKSSDNEEYRGRSCCVARSQSPRWLASAEGDAS
jgi:hypothetical protein